MICRLNRAEITPRLLLANPFQKRLKLRRFPQRLERGIDLLQFDIRKHRVKLLVAWLAERHALLGLAAARFGVEMMQRDQVRGDLAVA